MKRLIAISLILITSMNVVYSQSRDYMQMRDEGIKFLKQYQYSKAYKLFDGAEGFANSASEKEELIRLRHQLRDSVQSTYKRGIDIIQNAKSKNEYSFAIQELKKLIPTDYLNVSQIYGWLGTAYERLSEPYSAIEHYAQGVSHKERFCALRLAELLQKHKTVTQDSLVRLYEYAAPGYKEAYEILGDMFVSVSPLRAYNYYKNANSKRGNYQMATLLLTNKVSNSDNPIKILQQLTDNGYADAQLYLGLLYFHGKNVEQNKEMGLRLINAAKTNGNKDAKQWLNDRDVEIKRSKFNFLWNE